MRLEQRPGNIPLSKRQSGSTISLDAKGGPKDLGPACRKFEGFLLGELFKEMREAESSSRGIIPVSRAEGVYFWDTSGKRYLDFNSMTMCVNIGHGDRRVIDAM
ncbi:MAG: hypothetical protein WCP21_09960, partial [Armatimonadota bacterium]